MNASFVLIGLTTVLGSVLVRGAFRTALGRSGLLLIAIGGVGFVLVGLFPENVNFPPHRLGAGLQFVLGNLGLVLVGLSMLRSRPLRWWAGVSIAAGAIGLLATALFVKGHYLGVGIGGVERLAAYPLPLGMIGTGLLLWRRPDELPVPRGLNLQ